jgi:hypothetical protein
LGCYWDDKAGLLAGCKPLPLFPGGDGPLLKTSPFDSIFNKPANTAASSDCNTLKTEVACRLSAARCSWIGPGALFKDGFCFTTVTAPKK